MQKTHPRQHYWLLPSSFLPSPSLPSLAQLHTSKYRASSEWGDPNQPWKLRRTGRPFLLGFFFFAQFYKPTDHYNDEENKYAIKLMMLNTHWSGVSRVGLFTFSSLFLAFKLSRILGDAGLLTRRPSSQEQLTFTIEVNKYFEKWFLSGSPCASIEAVGFLKKGMPWRINDMRKQFSKKELTGFHLLSSHYIPIAKSYEHIGTHRLHTVIDTRWWAISYSAMEPLSHCFC